MKSASGRWEGLALLLIAILLCLTSACEAHGQGVGVKAGDWVKYDVECGGQSGQAWTSTDRETGWIKVEVLDVSDSKVTFQEIVHLLDGTELKNGPYDVNVNSEDLLGYHIIPANLSAGNEINISARGKLRINATISKSYEGATRDVNQAIQSYSMPYAIHELHCYLEFFWDRKTGFLLEWTFETYLVGYENTTRSVRNSGIIETNLWEMKSSEGFDWQQRFGLALAGLLVAVSVTVIVHHQSKGRANSERNSK